MRRILAMVSLALLVATSSASAQVELKPTIGLTFSGFSKDPQGGEAKAQEGWQFGGSILFGKKVYFEPGVF